MCVNQRLKTMKKTLIVLSFVASLLLLCCGCDRFKKSGGDTPNELPKNNEKGIAFEVFQRIPPNDLDEAFREKTYTCPEDCYRHFGGSDGNENNAEDYSEVGSKSFAVDCFPLNSGGWLVVLVNEGCFEGCNQTVKTYLYKDGILSFANGILPRPIMEEMTEYPFLIYGISDEEISSLKAEWDERLLYYVPSNDTLSVDIETLDYDDQFMTVLRSKTYVWNGESFAPIHSDVKKTYPLVSFDGLGGLQLNDTMPDELPGLEKRLEGEAVAFNRDGIPFVKLHPDDEGRIQAIDVFAKDMTYYRGKIGDTLNRLLYKGAAENKAYFLDGEFVVNEVANYTENRIDYVGPKDAMNGNFVEGPIENPKFKPGATVQYIRIYKFHEWENDTCDMRALRDALEDAMLDQGNPVYGINDFEYYRELYNEKCEGWCDAFNYYLHCYPLKNGGFKVYVTVNWQPGWEEDEVNSGYSKFSAYIYKNGQLTEVEPEPELNDFPVKNDGIHFSNVTSVFFYDRTITVATGFAGEDKMQGVEFTWDGTKMKKTFEGTFEN